MRESSGQERDLKIEELRFNERQHSYDLTQKLSYYVISAELIFCGYMLLNANELAGIHGVRFLYCACGFAAISGILWRFFYNETNHQNVHGTKGRFYRGLLIVQLSVYCIFVVLSLVTFVWILVAGFNYLKITDRSRKEVATTSAQTSGSEIFHLRSECAVLGEKLLNKSIVGSALTQNQTSHYNPQTNRCFVEIDVQRADLKAPGFYLKRYLYDGQTQEMLAVSSNENGSKSGMVYEGAHHKTTDLSYAGYDDAEVYINAMMNDDRQE